jgi:DNA-binding NarL/FixJ family response regulator
VSTDADTPARILVVDDHPVVRLGIRQMIASEPSLEVCGEADSMESALRVVCTSNANLALVDLSLADGHGLELIRAMREAAPDVQVLVLSMHDETLFAERALRAGARGYIMKQEAIGGLVDAIQQVLAGRVFLSDRMSQKILEHVSQRRADDDGPLGSLTDRELEVFEMLGRGLSATAIADALGVSLKTVETHRTSIRAKLGLDDLAALIRFAVSWTERL